MSDPFFQIKSSPSLRICVVILGLSLVGFHAAMADIVNRWTFDNAAGNVTSGLSLPDTISGANAVVRSGTAATVIASFSGTALTLPGATNGNQLARNISAYLDLPNGIISSKPNLTVEAWVTPISSKTWQRLFDFGRANVTVGPGAATGEIIDTTTTPGSYTGYDNLTLSLNNSATLGNHRSEGRITSGARINGDANLSASTTAGTEYHYVLTVTDGAGAFGGSGCQTAFYRNGVLQNTVDLNFRLTQIADVNNWIGRSQYGTDICSNIALNELRIYNHAMSAAEVQASYTAGANPTYAPPVAQPDAVTMHRGQKARIAVTANDTGTVSGPTVAIVQAPLFGTAVPDVAGKILYTHTTGNPADDSFTYRVSGPNGISSPATVTITFAESLRVANNALNVTATPPPVAIQAVPAFPGLTFASPTCLASPPGDTQRLFVCTKGGTVSVIPNVTAATGTSATVLTISTGTAGLLYNRVPAESLSTSSEQGLLGLAFHPNFGTNGYIFITYSVTINSVVYERLSRLTLNNPTAPTPVANTASELVLIQQLDEAGNHNGGDLHFGPDGYLYYSIGDEGDQNDQRFNSQRIDKDFFSGILRLDVDLEPGDFAVPVIPNDGNLPPATHASIPLYSGIPAFEIPADNPFIGATTFNGLTLTGDVRTEFWAVGMRNPWRFSFDTNGELWCGDVGGGAREEVDVVTRGGNYGWVWREGTITGPYTASTPPHAAPPPGFTSLDPLYNYQHGSGTFQGNSITGGFVYRGTRVPSLTGKYIFADYVSGNIWSLVRNGASPPTVTRILGEVGITAFAPDPSNGDVLMADYDGNRILRIAAVTDTSTFPTTLSATNLFADLTDLSPAPGLLPYDVNLPFWTDYAIKRRWFAIPSGTMTWSRDGIWTLPNGMIWVKHFDLETTRGNPAAKKRIETRLLVKNASGAYGVSYQWNAAGTEATLVSDAGESFGVNITVNGSPYTQQWQIPSRAACLGCHTPQAGHALSFNTRQTNLTNVINGFGGNQISVLHAGGCFANTPESPNVLPRHVRPDEVAYPIEARVRSYLAANCAFCHKTGGTAAPSMWDGRPELTLDQTGLLNGTATNNGGNPLNKLVVPGDTAHSIVLQRIAATNGFTRMPPLDSNELDQTNITLVTDWIALSLPSRQTYADWRLAQSLPATSEGDPTSDADFDGEDNYSEFLAGTAPLDGGSFLKPQVSTPGSNVMITLQVPANRSAQIETSTDLETWSLWNAPGNQGLAAPGGSLSITGPMIGPTQFFRGRLKEN